MKKLIPIVVVILSLALAGCVNPPGKQGEGGGEQTEENLENPIIQQIDFSWGDITYGTTELITKVKINNPNQVEIPLKSVNLDYIIDDIKLGETILTNVKNLPANQSTDLTFTTTIDNAKISDVWIEHIKNGEVSTVNLNGYLLFDLKITDYKHNINRQKEVSTDILSVFDNFEGYTVYFGPMNKFSITITSVEAEWGTVTFEKTPIELAIKIRNNNEIAPVYIPKLNYQIKANDIEVAKGSTEQEETIRAGQEKTIHATIYISNAMIDDCWVSHLQHNEVTTITVNLTGEIEIQGQTYANVDLTPSDNSVTIQTNLLP